jgi:HSP20 family molecular chaperone IbpA
MASTKLAFTSRHSAELATPSFVAECEGEELEQTIHRKIGERARLLFEESGRVPGNDEANWFRAESEILRSSLQVRESGSWVAVNASIPDASAQDMQVLVRPKRVIVRAQRQTADQAGCAEGAKADRGEIFLAANLTVEVQPASAVASFRDHNLQLMVKKSQPDKLLGGTEGKST